MRYMKYFCPWSKDCIGNGSFFTCTAAVDPAKFPDRIPYETRPACFKRADEFVRSMHPRDEKKPRGRTKK
jgi:hypothetical protein